MIGPLLEGGTIFPRSLKTTQNEKKMLARSKHFFIFFYLFINPFYEPTLVFLKFDPLTASGMALCVDLGPKCQIIFPLV